MSLLEVVDVTFSYAADSLYQNISFRLFEGEHAVLVGANGSGKSTLLKILNKDLRPDAGKVKWLPSKKIGYLDQYAKIEGSLLVKDYLYSVFADLFQKEEVMEQFYQDAINYEGEEQGKILIRAANIGEELIEADFYAIKSKVGNIIHGLGLEMSVLKMPIRHLSGGMRAKIILGKLLLEEADVLLLDEPTNFLDVKHIEWLARFLNSYEKAFIVVSHHEAFLKEIARTVFAIESKQVTRYKGDYEFYLKERELRIEQHKKAFVQQQKVIEKTRDFIQKNITRAKTTKRAQSRRKMLEKMVKLEPPQASKTYRFAFPLSATTGRDVLITKGLEIGYGEPLVDPIDQVIMKQEKVAITGKNGVGKSTFIKTILNEVEALDGRYEWIDTAKIAYYEQDHHFNDDLTPFQIIHNEYSHFTKKEVMSLLGHHGINFEMANRAIETLSGGELTKLKLALLYHKKGNVLILDEPTNHLDIEAKNALKRALMRYEGTLILVSHEKEFYQDVCDYEIQLYEAE
ncbi:MAG: ABC-F family ATP-binding cassette domain-containing protein [Bacilli bacterium]